MHGLVMSEFGNVAMFDIMFDIKLELKFDIKFDIKFAIQFDYKGCMVIMSVFGIFAKSWWSKNRFPLKSSGRKCSKQWQNLVKS